MATSGRMRASCFAQYGLVFTGTNDKKPWFFPRDTKRGVLLLTCPFTTNPGNCCSNSSLDLLFQNSMFLLRRDKTDETNANSCTHWHVYMNIYIWYTCVYWKSMIISHIFGMTKQLRSQPHTHSLSLNYRNPPEKIRKNGTCFFHLIGFYCSIVSGLLSVDRPRFESAQLHDWASTAEKSTRKFSRKQEDQR